MLGNRDAAANLAVKNLETAKKFYADTLGLTQVGAEGGELVVFKSGKSTINVYRSQYAGTNQTTAVTKSLGIQHDHRHDATHRRKYRSRRLRRYRAFVFGLL
jgi:catechol 2,3-dioxygenase-like lactoylglutathione lyase family enzyme